VAKRQAEYRAKAQDDYARGKISSRLLECERPKSAFSVYRGKPAVTKILRTLDNEEAFEKQKRKDLVKWEFENLARLKAKLDLDINKFYRQ
jgi:hypothetical protein